MIRDIIGNKFRIIYSRGKRRNESIIMLIKRTNNIKKFHIEEEGCLITITLTNNLTLTGIYYCHNKEIAANIQNYM